jgi:hypothetical protein
MVLNILEALFNSYFPTQYAKHIFIGFLAIYVVRTFSQGRRTNRERDLHARVVLVTVSSTFIISKGSLLIECSRVDLRLLELLSFTLSHRKEPT